MENRFTKSLIGCICLVFQLQTFAGTEPLNVRLTSTSIFAGNGIAISDNKFVYPNPDAEMAGVAKVISSTGQVALGIDQSILANPYTAFTLKVNLKVKAYDKLGALIPVPSVVTLEVKYNRSFGFQLKDKDAFVVKNCHKITALITSVVYTDVNNNVITNPPTVPTIVYLESDMITERIYKNNVFGQQALYASTDIVALQVPANSKELEINWPHTFGTEEYDLEYTFVNNYNGSGVLAASAISYSFNSNATRITTSQNYHRLSLIFEKGYLLFRVRAKGRDLSDPQAVLTGSWSTSCTTPPCDGGLVSTYLNYYQITTAHDDAKNWQYSASFAEDGKKKEVVSYYDGSLRNRQSITKINSTDNIVIGENLYDFQGRPAVNILPVPVEANDIYYRTNFNLNQTNVAYSKADFDKDALTGPCVLPTPVGMVNTSGASNYYSTANTNKDEQQAYVPDAQNFPFTQTEYTPDNTGRIRRQGGVGPKHQLDTDHETKYYYGQPEQAELDMLFGSEAGLFNHYKKNMTVDANGQISNTYIDMYGRTVATCLAGAPPLNVDPLTASTQQISSTYIGPNVKPNLNVKVGDNALIFTKEFLVNTPGNYDFKYSIEEEYFSSACASNTSQMCYKCVYDLSIDILDECGISILGTPYSYPVGIMDSTNFNCPGTKNLFQGVSPLTVNIALPGVYSIVKKLTASESVANIYASNYIRKDQCIKTLSEFDAEALAEIDLTGCHTDCSDCLAHLGLYSDHNDLAKATPGNTLYDKNYVYMTQAEYDQTVAECEEACKPVTECDVLYQLMLGDVSPSGQYAQYTTLSNGSYDAAPYALSILNTANVLPQSFEYNSLSPSGCTPVNGVYPATFRYPKITTTSGTVREYQDEDGTRSRIYVQQVGMAYFPDYDNVSLPSGPHFDATTNKYYVYPEELKYLKDFVDAFGQNPHWSRSLVEYHPEYGYYGLCSKLTDPSYAKKNGRTSEEFDEVLRNTNTFAQAVTAGLVNSGSLQYARDLFDQDPFFDNTLTNGNVSLGADANFNAKTEFLNNVVNNYKNTGKSLKQSATQIVRCNNVFYGSTTACEGAAFGDPAYFVGTSQDQQNVQDEEWRVYRDLYVNEKQKLSKNIMNKLAKGSFTSYLPNDDGFFNGPIGIGNEYYNPYAHDMVVLGSYWSFWWWGGFTLFPSPSFPTLISQLTNPRCQGYGAYDPAQPSHYATWPYYTSKTKRFITADEILPPSMTVNSLDQSNVNMLSNYAEFNTYQVTGQCPVTMNFEGFLNQLVEDFKLTTTSPYPLVLNDYFTKGMYDVLDPGATTYKPYTYLPSVSSTVLDGVFMNASASIGSVFNLKYTGGNSSFTWSSLKYFSSITFIDEVPSGTFNFLIKGYFDDDANPLTPYVEAAFSGSTLFKLGGCSFANYCAPSQTAKDLLGLMNVLKAGSTAFTSTSPVDLTLSPYVTLLTPKLRKPFGAANTVYWTGSSINSTTKHLAATLNRTSPSGLSAGFDFDFSAVYTAGKTFADVQFFSAIAPDASNINKFVLQAYVGFVSGTPKFVSVEVIITPPGASPFYKLGDCGMPPNVNCQTPQNQSLADMQNLLNDLVANYDMNQTAAIDLAPLDGFSTLLQSYLAPGNSKTWNYVGVANDVNMPNHYTLTATIGTGATACTISLTADLANPNTSYGFDDIVRFSDIKADESNLGVGGYPTDFFITGYFSNTSNPPQIYHVTTSCFQFKNCIECDGAVPLFYSQTFDSYPGGSIPSGVVSPDYTGVSGSACALNATQFNMMNENIQSAACNYGGNGMADNKDHSNNGNKNYLHYRLYPIAAGADLGLWKYTNGTTNVLTVQPNTTYEFSCWYRKNTNEPAGPSLKVKGVSIVAETDESYSGQDGLWKEIKGYWNSGTNTTADIQINVKNRSTSAINNAVYIDIDQIIFRNKPCTSINNPQIIAPDSSAYEPCDTMLTAIGNANAMVAYQRYIASEKANFKKAYLSKCLSALENFGVEYTDRQHHYTLYYYDQAGNLVKTVPPEGVEKLDLTASAPNTSTTYSLAIIADRKDNTRTVFTNHRMATTYEYNSLNQLINQSVPDHDAGGNWSLTNTVNGALPTLPAGVKVHSMDFKGQSGVLVGTDGSSNTNNGVIYSTTDGGVTWSPASSASSQNLSKIKDAGNSTIYAVCAAGKVLKSTNSGTSWSQLSISGLTGKINDLHFFTDLSGVIVGDNGSIYKTTNGGTSWTQQTGVVSAAVHLNDIQFTGANDGYICGTNGTLLYTSNAGASWNAPAVALNSNLNLTALHFYVPQTVNSVFYVNGFVTGYDASTNQGKTIYVNNIRSVNYNSGTNPLNTVAYSGVIFNGGSTPAKILNSIAIADPSSTGNVYTDDDIYTGGKNGEIYKVTYNSTTTMWEGALQAVPTSYSGEISQIAFTQYNGSSTPHAVVKNGDIIKKSGSSWTTLSGFSNSTPLNGIYFSQAYSSASDVYVVGNGGQIFKSTNGGTSFSNITQLSFAGLNDVSIAQDNSGFVVAVGNGGSVLTSVNNGLSWTSITPITTDDYYTVSTLNSTKALMGGLYGTMGLLNNGSLASATNYAGTAVNDIYFTNATTGYFVADAGKLYSTTNGGTSWTSQTSGTTNNLKSIHSYGSTILAVGDNGTVLRSIGSSFANISQSASSTLLTSVKLIDNLLGYAFGYNSTILKTQDGGLTWKLANSQYGTDFFTAAFTGQGVALVGGDAYGFGTVNLYQLLDDPGQFTSSFWYDRLGRLIISQNVKQAQRTPTPAYSYTSYDALGRIIQVGEITNPIKPSGITNYNGVINDANYTTWLSNGTKAEVTTSKYDQAVTSSISQQNLRTRVSATYNDDNGNLNDGYTAASFYSYDIHGNVGTLLEDNPGLVSVGMNQRYKKINYDYDLISGKVNEVKYQNNQPDAFYHKYYYDADNRLTNVYTSRNRIGWEQDAKYFYYKHGPLARVETGDEKVQGTDYAYTLHGWIKGVNSSTMKQLRDIGKDGEQTITSSGPLAYNSAHPSLNKYISQDAYGYNLNYYYNNSNSIEMDYIAIAGNASTAKYGNSYRFDAEFNTATNDRLYNGNISSMATSIPLYFGWAASLNGDPMLMKYKYDQLNRITSAQSYHSVSTVTLNNSWSGVSAGNAWKNTFTYDANGNILSQDSYDASGTQFDQLVYRYDFDANSKLRNNRLYHMKDFIPGSVAADDIDNQGTFTSAAAGNINTANNYGYDPIGNLIRDNQEQIGNIEWTVYGKIKKITRATSSTKPDLEYVYDASGNRITKIVKPRPSGSASSSASWVYTHYRRDAQGNVMAIYEEDRANATYKLKEIPMYGSSRLGSLSSSDYTSLVNIGASQYKWNHEKGFKSYELSNHLGNVIAVVSDRRQVYDDNADNTTDRFEAELLSYADYSPFGQPLSNRNMNFANYRYGFNGKENDNEIKGTGSQQDYGMRIYDPRLGKFLSVDPITAKYPELTPYQFASNRPIDGVDLDGLEYLDVDLSAVKLQDGKTVFKIESYEVDGSYLTSLLQGKGVSIHWKASPSYQHIKLNSLAELNEINPDNFVEIAKTQTEDACSRWATQSFISQYGTNKLLTANFHISNAFFNINKPINITVGMNRGTNGASQMTAAKTGAPYYTEWAAAGIYDPKKFEGWGAAFKYVTDKVVKSKGRIGFELEGLNIKEALAGDAETWVGRYTAWELQYITKNKELYNATDFFIQGVKQTAEDLKKLGIEAPKQ